MVAEFGGIDILVNNAARGMRFANESFMTEPMPFGDADHEIDRAVMGPPAVYLASDEAGGVHGQRIVAIDWKNEPKAID